MAEQKSVWTPRDLELLSAGIQCLNEGLPNVSQLDIAKFSDMTGLAQNSARTAWSNLRKKSLVGKEDNVAPKTPGTGPSEKKKAPAKRKSTGGKKGENGEDVDGGDENADVTGETPTKKPRGRPAAKPKATETVDEGDSEMKDDAEMPATASAKNKTAVKKAKAPSKNPEAEAEASPGVGDEDSEMKDDNEASAATPVKKKSAPRKPAIKKTKPATTTPEASPGAGDDDSEMKEDAEVAAVTPAKTKAAPKKPAVKKTTKAKSTTPDADVEASPAAGDDDSEMKDDVEVPAITPTKKKAVPRKPAAKKAVKATSKTPEPEAEAEAEVPDKASSELAQADVGSDDMAAENESITVETAKEVVQVEVTKGKTELTITEKEKVEEVEEVAAS